MSQLTNLFSDIATAIRAKTGSQSQMVASDFPQLIMGIPTGQPSGDDVRFFDYDGTLLHRYSATDFLALSTMPASPSHTGLTSRGWNWSLADAQAYVTTYGFLDIGQLYDTSDNSTRIYLDFKDTYTSAHTATSLYLGMALNGTVTVDWGDGTSENVTGSGTTASSIVYTPHTYSSAGNYVISISGNTKIYLYGTTTKGPQILTANGSSSTLGQNRLLHMAITNVEIGNAASLGSAFYGCYNLQTVVLPYTSTQYAVSDDFEYCQNLKHINLPYDVKLAANAFDHCYSLKAVCFPSYMQDASGSNAFHDCWRLERASLPLTGSVGSYIFASCPLLEKVAMPILPTSYSYSTNALYQCYNLKTVIAGKTTDLNNVISNYTFSYSGVENLTILGTTTEIGNYAFQGSRLKGTYIIKNGVTKIRDGAFANSTLLTGISIPNTVTDISAYALSGLYSVKNIALPNSVTSLGANAFSGDYSLEEVTLPNAITQLSDGLFTNCTSLSIVSVPSTVTNVYANVFKGCTNLRKIDFSALNSVPTLSNTNAFTDTPSDLEIVVPDSLYSTWIAANIWSSLASRIVKASEA